MLKSIKEEEQRSITFDPRKEKNKTKTKVLKKPSIAERLSIYKLLNRKKYVRVIFGKILKNYNLKVRPLYNILIFLKF